MTKAEKVSVDIEIDAGDYTEDKKREVEKIVRCCFLMDADKLHYLYLTALNMI